jgi:phosphonate transport system substrate-binding protein
VRNFAGSALLLTLLAGLLAGGCGPDKPRPLTLTIVPYEAADKLSDEYSPMATYLGKKAGRGGGRFFPVADYAGVVPALQSGQVDVAYLSSFPYALAGQRVKLHPLAMPYVKGSLLYRGVIFVRADSPIQKLQDLKGKKMAFGDVISTSGYLLPRRLLETNGVPLTSLARFFNAGDAGAVVAAVENGTADAGAAYQSVFEVVYKGHPEKAKGMRVIAQTEEIPNGIYVARGDLPAEEVEKLRKAFLDMNTDTEGRAAMLRAPNDKIVPPDDTLFDHVRQIAKTVGLDLNDFDKKKK